MVSGPLGAVRVVTVAVNVPGPVAAARLMELGATVTKVEPPGGDPLIRYAPDWYEELRSGQEVLRLDLKEESPRAVFDERLLNADVLLTSQRPNALAGLGLSTIALRDRYPRLLHVAIVGSADRPDQPGHDLTYLALDWSTSSVTVAAHPIGGSRRSRARCERGLGLCALQRVRVIAGHAEVSLAHVARDFAAPYRTGLTSPGGILGGALPTYAMYHAREGWVALAALEERLQLSLRNALGLSDCSEEALSQMFRERTAREWDAWAQDLDLPLAALPAEASDQPAATSRGCLRLERGVTHRLDSVLGESTFRSCESRHALGQANSAVTDAASVVSPHDRVRYSPMVTRPVLRWPGNAHVALWIAPNIEMYELAPPPQAREPWPKRVPHPDVMEYSLRDYGNRVGFWRMIDALDTFDVRMHGGSGTRQFLSTTRDRRSDPNSRLGRHEPRYVQHPLHV